MKNSLRFDFWVIVGIILVSIPTILEFRVRPLTSAVFFFIAPTIYLIFRKRKPLKRVFWGSILMGTGFGLIFNIITSANKTWDELPTQLVFRHRIFGFWPADEPIWFFLWALFIIVFYEHFYDRERGGTYQKILRLLQFRSSLHWHSF